MPVNLNVSCFIVEHYHLYDGGIAYVIADLLESLLEFRDSCVPVVLYSSKKYQDDKTEYKRKFDHPLLVSLNEEDLDNCRLEELDYTVHRGIIIDMPALAYSSRTYSNAKEFEEAASKRCLVKVRLVKQLLRLRGLVLHQIHNPTLMKNPVETYANFMLARSIVGEDYFQLRQICDLTESSPAPAPLRQLQTTIVGPGTTQMYGINGCGVAWHAGPNISYVTTNASAKEMIEECFAELRNGQVHWQPLPFSRSVAKFSDRKVDALRTSRVDKFLKQYAVRNGYTYLSAANLLLAAEVAQERKNTVEQLLILNLLNHYASDGQFQLLVTAFPTSKRDVERIELIRKYVEIKNLPAVMGFGHELTETTDLAIEDLWKHPRAFAALTTSAEEGFGLNFVNPNISSLDFEHQLALPTIGRMLPRSYSDFRRLGLAMPRDAFYEGIRVDSQLIKRQFSLCLEGNKIDALAAVAQLEPDVAEVCSVFKKGEQIELGRDFADYPVVHQLLLLELFDYSSLGIRLKPFLDTLGKRMTLRRAAFDVGSRAKRILSNSNYVDGLEQLVCDRLRQDVTNQQCVMLRDNTVLLKSCGSLRPKYSADRC